MTLCAWCGDPVIMPKKYNGELICLKCYERREPTKMEDWQKDLDRYLTTPPDEHTHCHCAWCNEDLFEDDEYWELDDEILCEECAEKWLESHKNWVSESMAKGG